MVVGTPWRPAVSRGMHMLRKGSRKRQGVDTKVLLRGGVRASRQGKWL